jgi:upstream activation factor subunit UAF30
LLNRRVQHAVRSLIEARFDAINSDDAQAMPTPPLATTEVASPKREANGHTPSDDADADANSPSVEDGEIEVSSLPPPNKKQKRDSPTEDADAKLAARLQAQENRLAQGRTTRGGSAGKPSKPGKSKGKAAKKKGEKRARPEGGSDADAADSDAPPKRKAGGGFQKPFNLSYPLAELCGEMQVSDALLCIRDSARSKLANCRTAIPPTGCQEALGVH